MTILEKIVAYKRTEVAEIMKIQSLQNIIESPLYKRNTISLKESLTRTNSSHIIAEFKRQSPSKGIINDVSTIEDVSKGYIEANVAAQSVLTDKKFFGGSSEDLIAARSVNSFLPILRKDFIVDKYQIHEAKALGADVILLIATCLTKDELKSFSSLAEDLGMETLFEIHTQEDLDKIIDREDKLIGINNRDLKTFKVDIAHSLKLADQLPNTSIKISESGISDPIVVNHLMEKGFEGFLIGEHFMKESNPGLACKKFIQQMNNNEN